MLYAKLPKWVKYFVWEVYELFAMRAVTQPSLAKQNIGVTVSLSLSSQQAG